MASPTRWGIISAGLISNDFCIALSTLSPEEHVARAVAARNLESAQAFAEKFNIPKAYGSYEELVKDPEIDVVYIGSINTQHLALAKLALDNGKPVLCEKPLCMNVKETKELIAYAQSKNIFLMEAMWSRFFPAYQRLREEIEKGTIGEGKQVLVTFGETIDDIARLSQKELGGGTVLDLGVYCAHFSQWVFCGEKPQKILAEGSMNEDGVDVNSSATLVYSEGKTATLITHSRVWCPNEALAIGTKGTLKLLSSFYCPTKLVTPEGTLEFALPERNLKAEFENPQGLRYEAQEVRRCLLNGLTQSPVVSHEETLTVAENMESIRKQIGVVYPQDE